MDFPGSQLVTHKQLMPAISQTKHIASSEGRAARVKFNESNRIRLAVGGLKVGETERG